VELIPIKPERKAQLEEYAQQHGKGPAVVLDESVEAIRRAHEDVKAGRTRAAAEFLEELRGPTHKQALTVGLEKTSQPTARPRINSTQRIRLAERISL
jgi:hypothetical protein